MSNELAAVGGGALLPLLSARRTREVDGAPKPSMPPSGRSQVAASDRSPSA